MALIKHSGLHKTYRKEFIWLIVLGAEGPKAHI